MRNFLIVLVLVLFGVSCAQRSDTAKCIQVDVTKSCRVAVDVESELRIPLESTSASLIHSIQGMFVYDSLYVVYTDNRLLRFSSDGRFLGTIGTQGRGGEEYIGIWSAWQTKDGISVYDMNGKKLMKYNPEGVLLSKIPLTTAANAIPFQKICPLSDSLNIGMTMYRGKTDIELAVYDESYTYVKTVGDLKLNDGLSLGYPFSSNGQEVLYWRNLENNIYAVDNMGNVSNKYRIDFGCNGIPSNKSFADSYEIISYLNSGKSLAGMIDRVTETDNYVFFTYLFDGGKYVCLCNKPDETVTSFKFVNERMAESVFLDAWLMKDNRILVAFEESETVVLYKVFV